MTREAEIRERWAKATPGPWEYDPDDQIVAPGPNGRMRAIALEVSNAADGDLIAHAPDDVAYLLDRADRLEAALRTVVSELSVRHHSPYTRVCEVCRAHHVARAALEGEAE